MPSPSTSLATLRPDLGGSLEEFSTQADRAGFIGLQAMPVIEVQRQAGTFGKITIESLLKSPSTARAPMSGYQRGNFKFTSDTYATTENGFEMPIDDRQAEMYRDYFDAEMISAELARDAILRNLEIRVAAIVQDAVTYSPTSVTNEWDDAANATPIADVETAAQAMYASCGLWPNCLVITKTVYRNLRRVAEVTDKIQYIERTLPGDINLNHLKAAFDLPYILVAGGTKNTANEEAAASLAPIWSGEYATLLKIPTTASITEPCFGRIFHWGADGSSIGATMETYRDEVVRANMVRARMDTHEKTLYSECIKILSNITT